MLIPRIGGERAVRWAAVIGFLFIVGESPGQSAWTGTDIGTTGTAGSYSYSSGTGTVAGAGTGVSGTADSCYFASTPASGNVEIITKVLSQTGTNAYATAGLMIRQSTSADAPSAYVSVSPQNGVNFTWRTATGGTSVTTLGPSGTAPVWLRIVKSGSSIAGYQSADATSWSLVGSGTFAMSGTFNMGLAVSSNVSGTLSTAAYSPIVPMISVPQRADAMQLWLR